MAYIHPDVLEREALQQKLFDLRREWNDLKREIAAKRAAERQEAAELRRKSDLAYENLLRVFKRYAQQHKYSPDQPRVPAGNPDGGQWTDGGGGGAGRDAPSTDFSAQSRRGGPPRGGTPQQQLRLTSRLRGRRRR